VFRFILALLAILAALAGLLIGTLNPEYVELDLLFLAPSLPLGLVLLAGFSAGILAGLLLAWLLFGIPRGLRRFRGRKQSGSTGQAVEPTDGPDLKDRDE